MTLIERLERADAPSRELFAEVFEALQPGIERADWLAIAAKFYRMLDAEAWESAALTLVPEGWSWSVGDLRGYSPPLWRCHVRDHRPQSLTPEGHSHIWREGNTNAGPAIAICIAAIKAKEADNGKSC